jgi:hypothetical protein
VCLARQILAAQRIDQTKGKSMAQESSNVEGSADVVHEAKDLIAADIDFKPYLEAANMASQLTRSTVYVLIAAVVMIFTAYRNTTYPDWLDARLLQFQTASACLKEGQSTTAPCEKAIAYCRSFLYIGRANELLYGAEFDDELEKQINELIRLRTEALSLRLPFFGVVIDMNDLGIIGGVFLASILYILHAGLYREVDNLDRAKRKARSVPLKNKQQENLELLLMAQVLASKKGTTFGVVFLLIAVVVMQGFVLLSDFKTYPVAAVLQGPGWAKFETGIDIFFFLFVIFLSTGCFFRQRELDRSVDDLIDATKVEETTPTKLDVTA